jgi:hypothetical protein
MPFPNIIQNAPRYIQWMIYYTHTHTHTHTHTRTLEISLNTPEILGYALNIVYKT